jgi:hypothetical protein
MKKGIIVDGKNLTQWAKELGVSRQRIQQRYHRYGDPRGEAIGRSARPGSRPVGRPKGPNSPLPKWALHNPKDTVVPVQRYSKYDTITYLGKSVREWGLVYDANYKRIIYAMNKSQKRKNPDIFHNLLKA